MLQVCPNCERVLRNDDEVVATVAAYYHELASKRAYSISKPHECLDVRHRDCNYVKGRPEGD